MLKNIEAADGDYITEEILKYLWFAYGYSVWLV